MAEVREWWGIRETQGTRWKANIAFGCHLRVFNHNIGITDNHERFSLRASALVRLNSFQTGMWEVMLLIEGMKWSFGLYCNFSNKCIDDADTVTQIVG